MRFKSASSHTESLVDGREVDPYGEFELSKPQYEVPEQWRRLGDGFAIGLSVAAEKLIEEAKENPNQFSDLPAVSPPVSSGSEEVAP